MKQDQEQKIEPYAPAIRRPNGCDVISAVNSLIDERNDRYPLLSVEVKKPLLIQSKLF